MRKDLRCKWIDIQDYENLPVIANNKDSIIYKINENKVAKIFKDIDETKKIKLLKLYFIFYNIQNQKI